MEPKTYEITLTIEAPNKDAADNLLEKMWAPLTEQECLQITEGNLKDLDERHYEERIRYVEDWHGEGEHYVFEGKWSDEDSWGLDMACKLFDLDHAGQHFKGELISYQALTKIRELIKMRIPFHFC